MPSTMAISPAERAKLARLNTKAIAASIDSLEGVKLNDGSLLAICNLLKHS